MNAYIHSYYSVHSYTYNLQTHTHMHTCIPIYTLLSMHIYTHIYTHVQERSLMAAGMVVMFSHTYARIHTYTYTRHRKKPHASRNGRDVQPYLCTHTYIHIHTSQERSLMAAGMVVMFSNLLNIITAFEFIGVLILTVYRMLTTDIFRFLIVYVILLYGFSIAMHVLVFDADLDNSEDFKGFDESPNEVRVVVWTWL